MDDDERVQRLRQPEELVDEWEQEPGPIPSNWLQDVDAAWAEVEDHPARAQPATPTPAARTELLATERAVLEALWVLRPKGRIRVQDVRAEAAARGCARSTSSVWRALERLVDDGYATRLNIRQGGHGRGRAQGTYRPLHVEREHACAPGPPL